MTSQTSSQTSSISEPMPMVDQPVATPRRKVMRPAMWSCEHHQLVVMPAAGPIPAGASCAPPRLVCTEPGATPLVSEPHVHRPWPLFERSRQARG